MLVEEAIYQVRCKTNDRDEVGLDDVEILNYINEAIQFINAYLVGANSPILIKELLITEPSIVLPKNFVKSCGTYPARITTASSVTHRLSRNIAVRIVSAHCRSFPQRPVIFKFEIASVPRYPKRM